MTKKLDTRPSSIDSILHQFNAEHVNLVQRARQLDKVEHAINRILDVSLRGQVKAAFSRQGQITLFVSNAATRSALLRIEPQIIKVLSQLNFGNLETISVKIDPRLQHVGEYPARAPKQMSDANRRAYEHFLGTIYKDE